MLFLNCIQSLSHLLNPKQISRPAFYGNQWALPDEENPNCQPEDETDPPVCDDTNDLQEAERMCADLMDVQGMQKLEGWG